jgi:hypothetical protein
MNLSPGEQKILMAVWLHIVHVGKNRASCFPRRSDPSSSRRLCIGLSRRPKEHGSIAALFIASIISGVGRARKSLLRSMSMSLTAFPQKVVQNILGSVSIMSGLAGSPGINEFLGPVSSFIFLKIYVDLKHEVQYIIRIGFITLALWTLCDSFFFAGNLSEG